MHMTKSACVKTVFVWVLRSAFPLKLLAVCPRRRRDLHSPAASTPGPPASSCGLHRHHIDRWSRLTMASHDPLDEAINPGGRIIAQDACKRLFLRLHELPEQQLLSVLERLDTAFRASAHNRHVCAGPAGMVHDMLQALPRCKGATREKVLELLRLLGAHRFSMQNMRSLLAELQSSAASAGHAETGGETARQAAGAVALELLELLCDIVAGGAAEPPGKPKAFWDMGIGVLGATGFELPADHIVALASRGAFTFCCWVKVDPPSGPTSLFSVVDGGAAGLQLQLHRVGANSVRAELLVFDGAARGHAAKMAEQASSGAAKLFSSFSSRLSTPRPATAPVLTGGAADGVGGGAGVGGVGGTGGVPRSDLAVNGCTSLRFEPEVTMRCGEWHFVTLSCRRGSLLSLATGLWGSSAGQSRDEALLCVDAGPATRAPGFKYPPFGPERAEHAAATVAAAASARFAAATPLRGQVGPFLIMDTALGAAEAEAAMDLAQDGRKIFEHPHVLAAWHPLLASAGGLVVATTAEGPWAARPRSEAISVVASIAAKDSIGGILNVLLPLLPLRRRSHPRGDAVLSGTLRLLSLLLSGHARNQEELLRTDALMQLGHLLRCVSAAHYSGAFVTALAKLAETAREEPPIFRKLLDHVLLRFDSWRRLEPAVQSALFALLNALAGSDEAASVGLSQRMLDAARRHYVRLPHQSGNALHLHCLNGAAMLASDRVACSGAAPLLAHALSLGTSTAEETAQAEALGLLLQLAETHGGAVLEPLQAQGGMNALLQLLLRPPPPPIAATCAKLLCRGLGRGGAQSTPLATVHAQWVRWMEVCGLSAVRHAFSMLQVNEALGTSLMGLVLDEPDHEVHHTPEPRIQLPQLLPAILDAARRAPSALRSTLLERLTLWLRQCPENTDAMTSQAPMWQPAVALILGAAVGREGATDSLDAVLCCELLSTYVLESLPRDERWYALEVCMAAVQLCGDGRTVQRARRLLLCRLLASLSRLGKRLALDPAVSAPKLHKVFAAVRVHALQPPPPPPLVHVRLNVIARDSEGGGGGSSSRVRLAMAANPPTHHSELTVEQRWASLLAEEGPKAVAAETELLSRACEVLDPLIVRAMMDDAADGALRCRVVDDSAQETSLRKLAGLAGSVAGSVAGGLTSRLKELTGAEPAATKRKPPRNCRLPPDNPSDSGAPVALPGATGTASGPGGSFSRTSAGGDPKLVAVETGAPAALPPSSMASTARAVELGSYSESSSLYDECLQCLLMLLRAPPLPATAEAAAADSAEAATVAGGSRTSSISLGSGRLPLEAAPGAETPVVALVCAEQLPEVLAHDALQRVVASVATEGTATGGAAVGGADTAAAEADAEPPPPPPPSPFSAKGGTASVHVRRAEQRLRELLWRDLEQGCTWAHLASQSRTASDDSHWTGRRAHVFSLVARLSEPLRAHALAIKEQRSGYRAELAEALVPLLQGVLRTYRHFLALEAAPPATEVDTNTQYGQLTVLAAQLGGVEAPFWVSKDCGPRSFSAHLSGWGPLLDTPPLRVALHGVRAQHAAHALAAAAQVQQWASRASRASREAADDASRRVLLAAQSAATAFRKLQLNELQRVSAADAREAASAEQAAERWRETQRTLQREQRAWEGPPPPGSGGAAVRWEHYGSEDAWRRMPLMLPNPALSDHREASSQQAKSGGSAKEDEEARLRQVATIARQHAPADEAAAAAEEEEELDEEEVLLAVGEVGGGAKGGAKGAVGAEAGGMAEAEVEGEAEIAALTEGGRTEGGLGSPRGSLEGDSAWEEQWFFNEPCELVWRGGVVKGWLHLSAHSLFFEPEAAAAATAAATATPRGDAAAAAAAAAVESEAAQAQGGDGAPGGPQIWAVGELKRMERRRYLLVHCALELFVAASAVFFNMSNRRSRDTLRRALRRVGVPERSWLAGRAGLLEAWQRRDICNFDYLMELNTLAGRTYNDLNQYPIFPWVLREYEQASLNLNDPTVYRDLARPMGALNPARLDQVTERYQQMDTIDSEIPPFHYGSHYSSAGAVLFWLLRMEPFTSYAIELQSGRFDHADRLFYSIAEAWSSCNTSLADVKELVPEFFYLPTFLENGGGFELGVRQDGKVVGDVLLPPWARSAEEFVALQRRALESEHVSASLHLWVDLIFGHKQRGKAAEEAHNVFFYLTYEGAVDFESPTLDEAEALALKTQIACFGQTPPQLFTAPHPPRRAALPFLRPVHWGPPGVQAFARVPLKMMGGGRGRRGATDGSGVGGVGGSGGIGGSGAHATALALVALCVAGEHEHRRVVAVDAHGSVHSFRWPSPAGRALPPVLSARRHCSTQLPASDAAKKQTTALMPGGDSGRTVLILSGGQWDGALCVSSEAGRTLQVALQHSRSITCIALAGCAAGGGAASGPQGGSCLLLTGSSDTTVVLWTMPPLAGPKGGGHAPTPLRALRGHVQEVTAVALSTELGLAASGAADGTVLLHTCHNGALLRRLTHPDGQPIGHLLLNGLHCRLVVGAATAGEGRLYLFSLSGVRLHCLQLPGGVRTAPATRTHTHHGQLHVLRLTVPTYLLWPYSLRLHLPGAHRAALPRRRPATRGRRERRARRLAARRRCACVHLRRRGRGRLVRVHLGPRDAGRHAGGRRGGLRARPSRALRPLGARCGGVGLLAHRAPARPRASVDQLNAHDHPARAERWCIW